MSLAEVAGSIIEWTEQNRPDAGRTTGELDECFAQVPKPTATPAEEFLAGSGSLEARPQEHVFLAVVPTPGLVSVVAFESSGAARPFPGAGVPRGTRRVGLVIVLTLLLVVPYSVSHPFVVNGGGSVSETRVGDVVVVGW